MGIIMGALGGLGAGLGQTADYMAKQALAEQEQDADYLAKQDLAKQEQDAAMSRLMTGSALEEQRQKNISAFTNQQAIDTANTQRQSMVDRVAAAKQGIISGQLDTQYTPSDNAVDDASRGLTDAPMTADQLAAIQQSKDAYQAKLSNDPKISMQAAIATGDITPEKAATMGQSAEINQMKLDNMMARAEDKNASMQQIASIRADAITASAQLRVDAANQRATNGKIDTATGRMLITSEDANIKASTSQLNMLNQQLNNGNIPASKGGKPNPEYQAIKDQMEDIKTDIKSSQVNKAGYLKTMGLLPDAAAPPKVSAPAPVGGPPYPDGTPLTGKDGKSYVVKNGVPVLQ